MSRFSGVLVLVIVSAITLGAGFIAYRYVLPQYILKAMKAEFDREPICSDDGLSGIAKSLQRTFIRCVIIPLQLSGETVETDKIVCLHAANVSTDEREISLNYPLLISVVSNRCVTRTIFYPAYEF